MRTGFSAGYSGDSTGILGPSTLVPVKAAWKDASVEACFPTSAVFEFVFTHLLLCKKITLLEGCRPLNRQEYTSIPGIAACSTLNISELINYEVEPALIIEWLEHEVPPVDRRCGQREMILSEAITGGIRRLLAALKTVSIWMLFVVLRYHFTYPSNCNTLNTLGFRGV